MPQRRATVDTMGDLRREMERLADVPDETQVRVQTLYYGALPIERVVVRGGN